MRSQKSSNVRKADSQPPEESSTEARAAAATCSTGLTGTGAAPAPADGHGSVACSVFSKSCSPSTRSVATQWSNSSVGMRQIPA